MKRNRPLIGVTTSEVRRAETVEPTPEGSAITHGVRIEGPAAAKLGPMVISDTPEAMEMLARIAAAT